MSTAASHLAPISGYLIVGFFAVVFVLAGIARLAPHTPRVRAKPLLTERERAARAIIERFLPHARVHVQVSMGALLQTERGFNRSETLRVRNSFSQKIVDFVIEDRTSGAILALVELDDRSHDNIRDRVRDAMTASAGYRTIRLPAGRVDHADIAARLQPLQLGIATVAHSPLSAERQSA
jgi:very-short-patch-repair endonuclease